MFTTRLAAAEAGHRKYTTGKPCARGHVAARYTTTGNCVECAREATKKYRVQVAGTATRNDPREFKALMHPDDHEQMVALANFLNQARGLPPVDRVVRPVDTRTEWEVWYDRHRVRYDHALSARWATDAAGPETHSPGWTNPGWHAAPAVSPEVARVKAEMATQHGGGAKPDWL